MNKRIWWCEMMQRAVKTDDLVNGQCYWDGKDCAGGWRLLAHDYEGEVMVGLTENQIQALIVAAKGTAEIYRDSDDTPSTFKLQSSAQSLEQAVVRLEKSTVGSGGDSPTASV